MTTQHPPHYHHQPHSLRSRSRSPPRLRPRPPVEIEAAYLGPVASFSHQAALSHFGPSTHLNPQLSFADVFAAVSSSFSSSSSSSSSRPSPDVVTLPNDATRFENTAAEIYGVVPIENSTNGSVVQTLDLLADRSATYPDIYICGELYLPIRHCLLVARGNKKKKKKNDKMNDKKNKNENKKKEEEEEQGRRTRRGSSRSCLFTSTSPPSPTTANENHHYVKTVDKEKIERDPFSQVKRLYSHPQVWGQCETFLSRHFKGVERQDTSSTSRAAELVAGEGKVDEEEEEEEDDDDDENGEQGDGEGDDDYNCRSGIAAIGSALCADTYGLEILAEGIEDAGNNVTRFFILRKGDAARDNAEIIVDGDDDDDDDDGREGKEASKWKTLITFTIEHTEPGALVEALMVFRSHGINLTSINSRPSREQPWHYVFLVECEGRREGTAKGKMDRVLEELGRATKTCRFWGSWKDELS